MKKRIFVSIIAICIAISMSSCKKETVNDSSADNTKTTEINLDKVSSDETYMEKYNTYVQISNFTNEYIDYMSNIYFSQFGSEDTVDTSLYSEGYKNLELTNEQIAILDEPANKFTKDTYPSFGEADTAIVILCDKIKNYIGVFDNVSKYYPEDGQPEDNFAQSQQLHTDVVTAYDEYIDAFNNFNPLFVKITSEQEKRDLENLKKQKSFIRYYAMKILIEAGDIQSLFYDSDVYDENITDMTVDKYKPLYDKLLDSISNFEKYSADAKQLESENIKEEQISQFIEIISEIKELSSTLLNILETGTVDEQNQSILYTFDQFILISISSYNSIFIN